MSQDFYSFDKVLRELQMQEEELRRLVSEGEIRAFRDQDTMKFKKEDVERFLKSSADTGDTLGADDLPEELVFDEDDADQEVGMATAAISDDSFLEEDDEPLELDEEPAAAPASRGRTRARSAAAGPRRTRVVVEDESEEEGAAWKVCLVASTLALILGAFVAVDAARGSWSGLTEGIAKFAGESFHEIKYTDARYTSRVSRADSDDE